MQQARTANGRLNVTGMLLYTEGSFFQVLEGPPAIVDEVYAKIGLDRRHDRVTKIIYESIPRRSFGGWTMGYSSITKQEIEEIVGLNNFFRKDFDFQQFENERVKKLLFAFAEGRWRKRLDDQVRSKVPH